MTIYGDDVLQSDSTSTSERLRTQPAKRHPIISAAGSQLALSKPRRAACAPQRKREPVLFACLTVWTKFYLRFAWVEDQDAPTGKYTNLIYKYVVKPGWFCLVCWFVDA